MTALTRQWSLHSKENKSIILPPVDENRPVVLLSLSGIEMYAYI